MKVMKKGMLLFFVAFSCFTFITSCVRYLPDAGPLQIALTPDVSNPSSRAVSVTGLSGQELKSLRAANWADETWQALLRVTVTGNDAAAVTGRYVVLSDSLQFQPRFPFDPGRSYSVRFDPARLPVPRAGPVVEQAVALPARASGPATEVTAIYPSAGAWPENLLRFYVHFSAPMSATTSGKYVHLLDDAGEEVTEALLDVETDLWNDDYTRCTVFFDPGRVKRGVGPNLKLGRAIREGRRYTIVVDAAWPDAHGRPLKASHRYEIRGGPPIERAIAVSDWRIASPASATRDPLTVTFPWPLDRALLMRAVGVAWPDGRAVEGDVGVARHEASWTFTPRQPWQSGEYRLAILTLLEDPSGNRVGRAFEIKEFEGGWRPPQPERVTLPFTIR
jgi:hypothetical protein